MKIISHNGMTLAEVLISFLLLSIVLVGGMGFYFNSTDVMTMAMHKKIAMEMATQAMEQIKNGGYGSLPNPASGNWETASTVTFGNFSAQKQRRVTDVEGTSPNINKRVEIQFNWSEPGRQTSQLVSLATYIAP